MRDVHFEVGPLGVFPAVQQGDGVAFHEGGDVLAHAVGPGEGVVGVQLCGVDDFVAEPTQAGGFGVEEGEVEVRQAGHGAADVEAFHADIALIYANSLSSVFVSRWYSFQGTTR